ncbi:acyl--CoA ligase [Saccharopolyspora sp. HNM0986]|uniref:class I adenylate-forming enzyme family protein n=1 Tax=Saccharopolyspora galaxeae TaxID=2781241 RepID=UPI00190DF703|nr:class I adenylate-forming enzyme family protein [Saccharopolyspora sp. HNM0986]MBK0869245.1 acyl--CoA ligase [Saccharopolyspora sp. HNM0986]
MGVLFDECADRRDSPRVHLDRPFDIAPQGGTCYEAPDLAVLVRQAAGWLAAAGAGRGDRVAIVKENHWDYDLLACAAIRLGAVPAQLSAQLPPDSVELLLKRLEPAVLVSTSAVLGAAGAQGTDLVAFARSTVVLDGDDPGAAVPGTASLSELHGQDAPAPRRRDGDAPLVINHTSGTTGVPKLVVHSARTIVGELARFEAMPLPKIGVGRDDTVLNANSFAHGRTFCWTGVVMSMAPRELVVLGDQDPDRADPLLRAHPPTIVEALPSTYVRFRPLTDRLDNPFRRTRLFISTYDAVHPPTIRAYLGATARRGPVWMQGWGQTETGPLTFRFHTRRSLHDSPGCGKTRDVGRPVPFKTRLRVVDPDTFEPVRRGRPGLVLARTAARCQDYAGESGRWAAKRHGDWWNTGDIGMRTRTGSVLLLDREVDRVPELSCLETEDVLEDRLPVAQECVVLGRPDAPPLPVVVTVDGRLSGAAWRRATRGLPPMQEPVALTWDRVPRTGTGKVRRLELLEQLTGSTDTAGSGRWT